MALGAMVEEASRTAEEDPRNLRALKVHAEFRSVIYRSTTGLGQGTGPRVTIIQGEE